MGGSNSFDFLSGFRNLNRKISTSDCFKDMSKEEIILFCAFG